MADDPKYDPLVRIRFTLDTDRRDIKRLTDQLHPIFQQIVKIVLTNPEASTELDAALLLGGIPQDLILCAEA